MRKDTAGLLSLALLLASALPLHADGGPPDCLSPTTSLASQVRGPVAGDESFLFFPTGPADVMFVLDTSGSMASLPQCGDMTGGWGGNGQPTPNRCVWPIDPGTTQAGRVAFPAHGTGADIVGTCAVASDTSLSWMLGYVPDLAGTVYDPGHATTAEGLSDSPTWGASCTGNNCLFKPTGIYHFQWNETNAQQFSDCAFRDSSGNALSGYPALTAAQATACNTCLNTAGFYFMQARLSGGSLQNQVLFRGAWLNKNPPKFMAARKVIKDMIWMDPASAKLTDAMRFGLGILADPNGAGTARIVVPLGPNKAGSYPVNRTTMVQARQVTVDALNRTTAGLPSYMSGSTPLATTLFGIGQYLTSPGLYTSAFGSSTFEVGSLQETVAGLVNASWAGSGQCSICWSCQHASIIVVTDGSPNSEGTLPSAFDTYDDNTYHDAVNCGPGSTCQSGQTATCPASTNVVATPQRADAVGTPQRADAVGTPVLAQPQNATAVFPVRQGNRWRCPDGTNRANAATACWYTCPGDATQYPTAVACGYYCAGSTTKRTAGYVCGYDCPGSTTMVAGSTICGYTCPGDTTLRAGSYTCYGTCLGDPNPHPASSVCWATCPNDTTHYAAGATCPCSCPGGFPAPGGAGSTCPLSRCCSPSDSSSNPPSRLPRIASWLHGNDLRTDLAGSRAQTAETYTISFGLVEPASPAYNPAVEILKATARMGGGKFNNASDATSLASAVYTAVQNIADRVTAFSAPAAASLSTLRSVAVEAVLTRFKPNDTATWEGHVYQGMLFDEFLNGCDPTKRADPASQPQVSCGGKRVSANFDGSADANGNATCSGVFLVDADCDEVEEDPGTGAVLKKGRGGSANLFWDAGFVLSNATYPASSPKAGQPVPGFRAADARTIYSILDGQVTLLDAAHATSFAPFMSLDAAWCTPRLQLWGICGVAPLNPCTNVVNQCAKAVIDFVHGWDVTSTTACGGPDRTTNDPSCPRGRERAWKLGDVFHSAPVIVRPPRDEFSCGTGFENQCTATIFSPASFAKPTRIEKYTVGGRDVDAYEKYRRDKVTRPQIVLVGSNDGMLHAFDAGVADLAQPPDALGVFPYTHGTGEELWAFVPPDLLSRLKDLTDSHQYMVDGNVMVKDVWVDGSTADPAVNRAGDNAKQYEAGKEEFHTLAVMSERAGGPHYTALDITDVTSPKFLWTFPRPGSDDARYMGQSWNDFAPGPPPIGPVRMALEPGDLDPTGRGFKELWITMINGGYDSTLTRGRAVFMLDVWTGRAVWRFTDDDFKRSMGYANSTSMFPVAGSVGAVDIGDPGQSNLDRDGYYDTATWADLGGNVFLARFWEPGTLDASTRRVNNWFAARAFEEQRRTDNGQNIAGRSPIFFMPDNVFDATTHSLRTFVGSGNRERSLSIGNECNPDNLLGCCTAGCTLVTASSTDDFGTCQASAAFRCEAGQLRLDPTSSNCSGSLACGPFRGSASLHFECPSSTVDVNAQITCDANGVCSAPTRLGTSDVGTLPPLTTASRFYGFWSFGGAPAKQFETEAQARVFEQNRFTDVSFSGCGTLASSCSLVDVTQAVASFDPAAPSYATVSCRSGSVCQATTADPGWFYEYGKVCPLSSCSPAPPWYDEKTGAPASTVFGCVAWGGFRSVGVAGTGDPCSGKTGNAQVYGYMADYMSGAPSASCGFKYSASGVNGYARAVQRNTVASPNAQTIRVVVSPSGEVKYQGLEFPPAAGGSGAVTQTDYGVRPDTSEMMYWLEVPRDLHDCRHNPAASGRSCQ